MKNKNFETSIRLFTFFLFFFLILIVLLSTKVIPVQERNQLRQVGKSSLLSKQTPESSVYGRYDLFLQNIIKLAVGNSIWIAVTNRGDIESGMTENCWYHLEALNITNYIFVAVDKWSFRYLTCKGINSYWDLNIWDEVFYDGSLSFSDDPKTPYQKLMSARLNLIDAILNSGINIFFSDTDVVWIKNAFDEIEPKSKQYDIIFLHDGKVPVKGFPTNHLELSRFKNRNPKWNKIQINSEPDIQSNAGSFFMQSNERTKLFWISVLKIDAEKQKTMKVWSDQRSLAYALKRTENLSWVLESRSTWVNGWTIKNLYKSDSICFGSSAGWTIVHMNYNRGQKRKIYHFRRCGLWSCMSNNCYSSSENNSYCFDGNESD